MMDTLGFRPYECYEESNVRWIGKLPSHWKVERSKWLFFERKERARRGEPQLAATQKYGVIPQSQFMEIEKRRVTQVFLDFDILKHVESGDFVMSMRSFQGGIEYSEHTGCVSSAYVALRPGPRVEPAFFRYLLKSTRYIEALQSTSNLVRDGQALRFDNFSSVDLFIVPIEEQRSIAAFLDEKCAKIDVAVKIKEDQITLLRERRQINIQDAVTRGLNPTAPMKDSGIDWIGQIPEHWGVRNAKWLFSHRKERARKGEPQLAATQKYGVIPQTDFMDLEGRRVVQVFLDFEILKHVDAGDFVMSMRSFQGGIEYSEYTGCVSSAYVVLKPGEHVYHRYFKYLLKSSRYIEALQSTSNLVRDGQALRFDNFSMVDLLVVPLGEQKQIADDLDLQDEKTERAIAIKECQIAALKEYKTSLINAAVTGKIKVI